MSSNVLSRDQLNRATLARQMLLQRAELPVLEAVEQVGGLQSQIPNPPYIGLWTRLEGFERDALTQLMERRQVVRAAMMRLTLHVVSARDHQRFREVLQPAITRANKAFNGREIRDLDIDALIARARPFLEAAPRTTGELAEHLADFAPDRAAVALAQTVRAHFPLVQIPPGGTWGSGTRASYVPAAQWLGPPTPDDLRALFRRYLAAFGPASIMDFQAWSGLTNLKSQARQLVEGLPVYYDEQGRELYDVPDAPRPDDDTPTPTRFLPEYDNLLVAYAERTRIISDADRPRVFLSAARVRATILVDGYVAGAWKTERKGRTARLLIEPFRPLAADVQDALVAEGKNLVRFIEDQAEDYHIEFVS